MAESRLQRWSRKKAEVSKKADPTPSVPVENEPSPEAQELAINEALPESEVLEKYGLPEPDTIELGTDITGFMRKEIPELLRRKALRALWKSNPVLAVLDGLNDYDEDFTEAAHAGEVVKTLYKVGQGMFDKAAKRAEQAEELTEAQVGLAESVEPPSVIESAEPEKTIEPSRPNRQPEPDAAEEEPAPIYRPRMRFE
ncbi:DUF3306 domain-containing protein [Marinobacter sp. SS5-14b]|uniref:DUF3306 domain-containing protein n=1 Tax=Marinobacter sp. SS5-14b TaxID=3050456 RepID=UPI0026E0B4DB|nr:DUF3306 domain-containing protein [Marinobacter sp. SS5-14b]